MNFNNENSLHRSSIKYIRTKIIAHKLIEGPLLTSQKIAYKCGSNQNSFVCSFLQKAFFKFAFCHLSFGFTILDILLFYFPYSSISP